MQDGLDKQVRESLEAKTSVVSCWFIPACGQEACTRGKGEERVDLRGDLSDHLRDMKKADLLG